VRLSAVWYGVVILMVGASMLLGACALPTIYSVGPGDVVELPLGLDVRVPVGWSGTYEEWPEPGMSEEPILYLEEDVSGDIVRIFWLRTQGEVAIAMSSLQLPPSRSPTRTAATESIARSLDASVVAGTSSHPDDRGVTWVVVDAGGEGLQVIFHSNAAQSADFLDQHLSVATDLFERRPQ